MHDYLAPACPESDASVNGYRGSLLQRTSIWQHRAGGLRANTCTKSMCGGGGTPRPMVAYHHPFVGNDDKSTRPQFSEIYEGYCVCRLNADIERLRGNVWHGVCPEDVDVFRALRVCATIAERRLIFGYRTTAIVEERVFLVQSASCCEVTVQTTLHTHPPQVPHSLVAMARGLSLSRPRFTYSHSGTKRMFLFVVFRSSSKPLCGTDCTFKPHGTQE